MDITSIFFYTFSAVMLFAAFKVITSRNPVHSALYLVLCFFQASAIWMLLQAEFLSITLILVYVGAVMVLFLFVVMMLDIRLDAVRKGFWRHVPLALVLGGLVVAELIAVLWAGFSNIQSAVLASPVGKSNTHELGLLLYTQYLYPIQAAAVILLVAMIAAIALTLRERKDSKAINPSQQVHVNARDRLVMVSMPPTRAAVSSGTTPDTNSKGANA